MATYVEVLVPTQSGTPARIPVSKAAVHRSLSIEDRRVVGHRSWSTDGTTWEWVASEDGDENLATLWSYDPEDGHLLLG